MQCKAFKDLLEKSLFNMGKQIDFSHHKKSFGTCLFMEHKQQFNKERNSINSFYNATLWIENLGRKKINKLLK